MIPLGLVAAASATDKGIHKKYYKLDMTKLIISNEEIKFIIKIFINLEESGSLKNNVSKWIKNEAKEQKVGFLGMFFGTLPASLLENMLAGKRVIQADKRKLRAG